MHPMSHIRRFDHVGITVADLDTVTTFFVGLGLEVEGTRMFVEGEFLDTVIGIPDSRTEIVMLRPPDGGTRLELSSFVRPDHEPGSPAAMANELGLRNVAYESTTSRRPSTGWPRTVTAWSAASVSTSTSGAWPTCVDRRGSSCPWLNESADAPVVESRGDHAGGLQLGDQLAPQTSATLGVKGGVAPTDPLPVRSRYTSSHHNEADTATAVPQVDPLAGGRLRRVRVAPGLPDLGS
jgi:catechol 2,3-dioxygenase-like lactoylglutathione lyase family enzyme